MAKQARNFGAEFLASKVNKIEDDGDFKLVYTDAGVYKAFGLVIATGAHPRHIGFKNEEEFKGRGVAYCATCDGEFFTGKEVFVIGGGFAAAEESIFLTKYATHVTVLVRGEDFSCAPSVSDKTKANEKITCLYNKEVISVDGDQNGINTITYKDRVSNEVTKYHLDDDTFGVFVFAGYQPESELVKDLCKLDKYGYIETNELKMTSREGIYAAGDICIKPLRQVVTAVGDGAIAATELEKYVSKMHDKTHIIPEVKTSRIVKDTNEETEATSLFTGEIVEQLKAVFSRMENNLTLKYSYDDKDSSKELKEYLENLKEVSEGKIELTKGSNKLTPAVEIYKNGKSNVAFHGVPGGHEFTSFVLGLYNIAGPGQALDESLKAKIEALDKEVDVKVLVTLSCSICPELVIAIEKIASLNPKIKLNIFDVNLFLDLKEKYNVMSVPCLIINDTKVFFGKKDIPQLIDILSE